MKPPREVSRTELENAIREWVFSERDRAIISRRLLDGITYSELEEEFHISERQIKNIVYKAENKIYNHI